MVFGYVEFFLRCKPAAHGALYFVVSAFVGQYKSGVVLTANQVYALYRYFNFLVLFVHYLCVFAVGLPFKIGEGVNGLFGLFYHQFHHFAKLFYSMLFGF